MAESLAEDGSLGGARAPRWGIAGRWGPWALLFFRMLAGPAVFLLVAGDAPAWTIAALIVAAFLSDWCDGVLARWARTVTRRLRQWDGVADAVFYLFVLAAAWQHRWPVLARLLPIVVPLFLAELLVHAISLVRFGGPSSTHAWSCKAWAVLLVFAAIELLALGQAGYGCWLGLAWGLLAETEVVLILLWARRPPIDVRGIWDLAGAGRRSAHEPEA